MKVAPPRARATVLSEAGTLRVSMPARRRWLIISFLSFWVFMWLYVGGKTIGTESGPRGEPVPFFFLVFWVAAFAFAAFALLWMLAGREVLQVDDQTLALRRQILGIGLSREFASRDVRNVRFAVVPYNPWDPSTALLFWGLGGGPIAFDYGSRTYRFGAGLDEAEARDLISLIEKRLSGYAG